jgi:hypothetical protein
VAERDLDEAAIPSREAGEPASSDLEAARAWAMANDPECTARMAAEKDRLDRELVKGWKGSGIPVCEPILSRTDRGI